MATTLQVNANTQQAVGAFNQLAQAIAGAQGNFQNLNVTLNQGATTNRNYGNSLTQNLSSAFDKLSTIVRGFFDILTKVGAGLQLVFTSLLRELDKIQGFNAIMSVSVKNSEDAAGAYNFLRGTADKLGVQFDALSNNYAKLVAAIPDGTNKLDTANRAFLGVAMAARTLHSTNADTQLMFYAITQMASKGVVSMEELRRQLGEKLPGTIQIAARALSTTPELLEQAIRKGLVNSEKFLRIFGDELIRTFGDSSEKASTSVSAAINRLTNVWVDFVKVVLDSGAGNAIVAVFDSLREKLSDPYIMARFADMISNIANRVADFVKNLTADDIRNGFDTFAKGADVLVNILGKVVEIFTWIINNGGKAGAIIGAIGGASLGLVAGPVGAAVGAVAGAAAGGYVGNSLTSTTFAQDQARFNGDLAARRAAEKAKTDQEFIKQQMMLPTLSMFKGLDQSKVGSLLEPKGLTQSNVAKLIEILDDKRFKTDSQKAQGAIDFAKTGIILSPNNSTLKDVLATGKPAKMTAEERSIEGTRLKAFGLNPDVLIQMSNLNTLYKSGKIDMSLYESAMEELISKQPYMIKSTSELSKETRDYNKSITEYITLAIKQSEVRDEINQHLDDQLRLSTMLSSEQSIEAQVTAEYNRGAQVGLDIDKERLRVRFELIQQNKDTASAEQRVLSATVDKYKPQTDMLKGIDAALADPRQNFTKQNATDYIVGQDPNAQGSDQYLEAQRRSTEEYYSFVNGLRSKDLVSEQTAQMMKAKAQVQYDTLRLSQVSEFFGNLSSLSGSSNKKLAAIGKAGAIVQATIDGVLAVQKAYTTIPYPWNIPAAAAMGIIAATNIAKIRGSGFETGGYTGNGGTKDVAGVVHGQEFVMNAQATARNRPMLEALNSGASGGGASTSQTNYINITVNSDGSSSDSSSNTEFAQSLTEHITTVAQDLLQRELRQDGVITGAIRNG